MDLQNLKSVLQNAQTTSTEPNVQTLIQDAIGLIDANENRSLEQIHNDTFAEINTLLSKGKAEGRTRTAFVDYFTYNSSGAIIKAELKY